MNRVQYRSFVGQCLGLGFDPEQGSDEPVQMGAERHDQFAFVLCCHGVRRRSAGQQARMQVRVGGGQRVEKFLIEADQAVPRRQGFK